MKNFSSRIATLGIAIFFVIASFTLSTVAQDKTTNKLDETFLKNLQFRSIGPAIMGGRIDDIAVVESNPRVYYVGAATGGAWQTVNNGTPFEPIFDTQSNPSIGDIALAPSDPNIIWVGTGEPNNR